MRSKASFKGHPLHPALIPFPFAFLTGALLFDAAALLLDRPAWAATGGHLAAAGILTALVAAVPGLVDYFYSVPPRSSGKRRATQHLVVNLAAVALFAAGWLLRRGTEGLPGPLVVGLELVAVGLLAAGGWMGGTLVNRNQIGVDHRYAGAGRWNEARLHARPGEPLTVARADELEIDQLKLLHVDGRRIVLGRGADGWVAFDDACTHSGASLADGVMICGTVQCPWHGSQFDLATGKVKAGPATRKIQTYRVERRGDEIRLQL